MSLAVACFLPLVMLAMLLLLARIEERHLKARPIITGRTSPDTEPEPASDHS